MELAKLKNRYLNQEFGAIELYRRASYYMHDYSGSNKSLENAKNIDNTPKCITTTYTTDIEPNPYLRYINHTDYHFIFS